MQRRNATLLGPAAPGLQIQRELLTRARGVQPQLAQLLAHGDHGVEHGRSGAHLRQLRQCHGGHLFHITVQPAPGHLEHRCISLARLQRGQLGTTGLAHTARISGHHFIAVGNQGLQRLFIGHGLDLAQLQSGRHFFDRGPAHRLHQAEQTREQIRAISLDSPTTTIEDAYAVQREWVSLKIAEGRTLKGHKIGLTSKAMQASSQISEPDYGALLDDMFFHDGSDIPTDRFIVPRIEVELAFVLAKPLRGPNCTIFDVYNATDYVIPALELIDARCHNIDPETQRPRKVFDTISDNAANAGVILGGRPIKPDELDLRWISALMYRNGVIEETGVAAGVLNHPANGVAWLANKLAPYDVQLEAGQIILGGSFTRPVPARKGDTFHVDYGNMGSISCRFV